MVQFASRMDLLKGSEIRELLKLTAQPDMLSFAGGMPAPELFPVEQMMQASEAVLKEHGREALQYSTTEGFPRLREQIAERMLAKNNIHTDADHILVTSGSQQGLDFSARVFLNPGDVVLLESPSYLGAVNAFKACEPTFIEVPTDDGGMIMEELEKILARADLTELAGHLGGVLEGTRRMTRIIGSLKKSAERPSLMRSALGQDVLKLEDDSHD